MAIHMGHIQIFLERARYLLAYAYIRTRDKMSDIYSKKYNFGQNRGCVSLAFPQNLQLNDRAQFRPEA